MARFSIVPERSQVWIDARSNVHPIHSATTGLEGYVDLALEPGGTLDLSTPPTGKLSLSVDKLKGGNRMEDREMQKRIDAQRYPRIEGELDQVTRNGSDDSYRVSGNVTFRGVKRHHEDLLSIDALDDQTIRLTGSSRFDIREFGMQAPKVLMLKVEPEVDVRVEIVAVRDEDQAH
jgi:hypothetical protein